jgi:hypothetical protein
MTAGRIGLGLLGLLVAAWFGLGVYQSHAVTEARSVLAASSSGARPAGLTAAQARHADAVLHDAATLSPDQSVDVLRAQVALARGYTGGARRILNDVVGREPQNLAAWIALANASLDDVHQREIALLHVLALAPIVKPVG